MPGGRHGLARLEISLHQLARHRRDADSTLRDDLHNAVVDLHNAGCRRNHHV